jgi:hypothetical protein
MNQKDREKLKKLFISTAWEWLTAQNLDDGYATLTEQEKLLIVKSIVNDTDDAKRLIKQKFFEQIEPIAEAKTAEAIETGVIPLNLIKL